MFPVSTLRKSLSKKQLQQKLFVRQTKHNRTTKVNHCSSNLQLTPHFALTGAIYTTAGLNFEATQRASFMIQVSDGQHLATTTVHVTVDDVNDNAPRFVLAGGQLAVIPRSAGAGKGEKELIVSLGNVQLLRCWALLNALLVALTDLFSFKATVCN